jgi:hypothetical protein
MLAAVIERPGAVAARQVPAPQAGGLALVRVGVAGPGAARALAASEDPGQLKVVLDVAGR